MRKLIDALTVFAALLMMWSCSTVKHVPEGEFLLNTVKVKIEPDTTGADCGKDVEASSLVNYLRQQPNHKVLGFLKLQLATYNLSGRDSTGSFNKWLRRLGQAPVIYDEALTAQSQRQLRLALVNRGYTDASVSVDTIARPDKKKIDVTYRVTPGCPHVVRMLTYDIDDEGVSRDIMADYDKITLRQGMDFDRNMLEAERVAITERLRDKGYYDFVKDYITFIADTSSGSKMIDLTMKVRPPYRPDGTPGSIKDLHKRYLINRVYVVTDADNADMNSGTLPADQDTVDCRGVTVVYGPDRYLSPGALEDKVFLQPGRVYSESDVNRTYEGLSRLSILKYVNIVMRRVPGEVDGDGLLNAWIYVSRTKKQGVSVELEGTNSEGDLGFGVGMTYQHRNLWHRAEVLTAKVRTSYESISGNLEGLINNRYTEVSTDVGLTFPRFMFPFISRDFKRKVKATSEVAVTFNYQERPEYTRLIMGAGWKYHWTQRNNTIRRTLNLIDLNVVSLPKSTLDFLNTIAPANPLLRYSYEDHFIMDMAYSYYRTNRRHNDKSTRGPVAQPDIYTLRVYGETAGNVLYAASAIGGRKRSDGVYKVFGIQFAQYLKGEIDYTRLFTLDSRNSFAFRGTLGIATPYGNSRMIPFEKRFYAGGANGVRGWGVRTLGPGSYDSRNSVSNFINQCGDINLVLSAEYRCKLFWVLEGAIFADAGNIWTMRDYENQPGGVFKFDKFYRQIAASYGLGLRLDFTYFLLRLDVGMKAHNPAVNQEPWPLIHPKLSRDATFHFAVGYPF